LEVGREGFKGLVCLGERIKKRQTGQVFFIISDFKGTVAQFLRCSSFRK
jgi:hypothetical protein